MTNTNQKLLNLILEGKDTNEILETLKISPKQLKIRLEAIKHEGYNLAYNISDDGKIKYEILKNIYQNQTNTTDIKLVKNQSSFTGIVISDLHVGHKLDRLKRMDLIYEYMDKEDINIIINCGDIIDGCCNNEDEETVKKQIEKLIKEYPFDPNIINLICFGNHCLSPLTNYNIDISNILCAERSDFISLGFGLGILNIEKNQIIVSHPIKDGIVKKHWDRNLLERTVIFKGHGHHYVVKANETCCIVKVPTLSDIMQTQNSTLPGAVKFTIEFDEKKKFETLYLENLIATDKIYTAGYFRYKFDGINVCNGTEKDFLNQKTKKLV